MNVPDDLPAQFERFYPAVFRYFRLRGADADTANDLASAAFERALQNRRRFDPRRGSFGAWIFTIARNLAANHWASPASRPADLAEDLAAPGTPPELSLIEMEERQALLAALAGLDERERDLLALKFASRFTNRQIAELSGLSESNVGVILYRALNRLRIRLSSRAAEVSHE
ncbi:RNA polymerase sigma factor, sigma-70 family [Longilinea arvoryzae]|uniref:RNA polymerase sigma factor, sigma-70 family n=1 Tax=Longilinea arvoryzae TaxID=360412 RepID=A0A0S7B802_9CHLR|nr:sigma-70 family RNA polymerase sigma factor [Longilinea arvoryzae]GAP13310.1 RNA polymerase sigma factor, sigma-70 family [Longilinea arvoryzae]